MGDQDLGRFTGRDRRADRQPVRRGHFQAVFTEQLRDLGESRQAGVAEQLEHHRRADLVATLGIEVHLVDGATGGEDRDGHGLAGADIHQCLLGRAEIAHH